MLATLAVLEISLLATHPVVALKPRVIDRQPSWTCSAGLRGHLDEAGLRLTIYSPTKRASHRRSEACIVTPAGPVSGSATPSKG
jgi:hypothetical protein